MNQYRSVTTWLSLIFGMCFMLALTTLSNAAEKKTPVDLPKAKQTSLGLYVTAAEAYEKWLAAPESITVFDVRTPEEYIYVGHAPMAWNIPLAFQSHDWDEVNKRFAYQMNPDFISLAKEVAGPDDTILVMCRSGGRSAMAVNALAEAGFKNVYNITDGMEGDAVKDPLSVYQGQRLRNGWKNSGLPWSYSIDPQKVKQKK